MNHRAWLVVVITGALGLAAGVIVDRMGGTERPVTTVAQTAQQRTAKPDVVGRRHPRVQLPDLAGNLRSLDEFRDQVILLNFWATWCPPCLEEIPALMALQSELHPAGLQVIGLALDEREATREFVREHGVSYPILIGGESAFALAEQFGNIPASLPYTAVIGRNGVIEAVHRGALSQAEAAELVRPLL